MKGVIIQGSSRGDGNTDKVLNVLLDSLNFERIDLHRQHIQHYDYAYNNQEDDFLPLIKKVVRDFDIIIFATPIYWYAMSGLMKVFFDRLPGNGKTSRQAIKGQIYSNAQLWLPGQSS